MRYRKFSPINREHPIFELVDGDVVLFDVSRSDEGKAEIGRAVCAEGGGRRDFLEPVTITGT